MSTTFSIHDVIGAKVKVDTFSDDAPLHFVAVTISIETTEGSNSVVLFLNEEADNLEILKGLSTLVINK